jgi:type I restriction enzyme S subunit
MEEVLTKVAQSAPPLRFRGFKDDWKKRRLDAVTARIQDGTHFSPPLLDEGQYRYISARNIRNGKMLLHDMQYVDEEHHRDIYKRSDVKFGDVLLTKDGASTGNVCLNELHEEFSLLSSVAFMRADEVNSTNEFIYQYLFSPYGQSEVKSVIAGQAITRITLEKLRAFKFAFPTLPEQQKIAAFLGAVDRKIQQLTRKQELLEQYKKGVVQQLFSQELRFKRKDGGEFPEWEEKRLGDVLNYEQPTKYIVQSTEYSDVYPTPVLTAGKTFILGYTDETNGIHRSDQPVIIFDDFTTANKFVDFPFKVKSSAMKILSCDPQNASIKFVYEAMQQIDYVVGDHKRHWISIFEDIEIPFPSLEEQSRIAGFLMALDAKVAGVAQAVAACQKWKKGLLQQMFV